MDRRTKQKLSLPKGKTFSSGDGTGLENMIRESMYFVWPVAGISQSSERSLEKFMTHEEEVFEGEIDEDENR